MDTLTSEILHNIFIHLESKHRLVCTFCLSQMVAYIGRKRNNTFKKCIHQFEQRPHRAAPVEVLVFETTGDRRFHRNIFFKIFPNARVMRAVGTIASKSYKFIRYPSCNDVTKSNIQVLYDIAHCELLYQVLDSDMGGRLKSLYLDFSFLTGPHSILCRLNGLPVLKKLYLVSPEVDFYYLEALHNRVPTIQEFFLYSLVLQRGGMSSNILPAIAIIDFAFSSRTFENEETHIQFYQYMAKKYINVTDGVYHDRSLSYRSSKELYLHGIFDFYKAIGPRQSNLNLYGLRKDADSFEPLDAVDSQIKHICFVNCGGDTIFQHLSQSRQFNHIETLDIDTRGLQSLHLIKTMPVLTTLKLHLLNCHIIDCLDACPPVLKPFVMKASKIYIDGFNNKVYPIETLDLEFGYALPKDAGNFISSCFPHMVKLKLKVKVKENIKITLGHPHFQEATFTTFASYQTTYPGHGFSFTSPNQAETKFYVCGERDAIHVHYDDMPDLPLLSVVSCTDKQITINKDIKLLPW